MYSEPMAPSMAHPVGLDFLVNKSDWKQHRFDEAPVPDLADGQILFRVDRFAFTANNISYALAGESLRYWDFFAAPEDWGRLPTMGYADVIESKHAKVAVGTRCFGFSAHCCFCQSERGRDQGLLLRHHLHNRTVSSRHIL